MNYKATLAKIDLAIDIIVFILLFGLIIYCLSMPGLPA